MSENASKNVEWRGFIEGVCSQRFIRRYGKTRANGDTRTDIDIPWVHFKPIMDEVMIVKLRIDLEF